MNKYNYAKLLHTIVALYVCWWQLCGYYACGFHAFVANALSWRPHAPLPLLFSRGAWAPNHEPFYTCHIPHKFEIRSIRCVGVSKHDIVYGACPFVVATMHLYASMIAVVPLNASSYNLHIIIPACQSRSLWEPAISDALISPLMPLSII